MQSLYRLYKACTLYEFSTCNDRLKTNQNVKSNQSYSYKQPLQMGASKSYATKIIHVELEYQTCAQD